MAKISHYLDESGTDVITDWASGVPKRQLVKLQAKLDMLRDHGSELPPQLLADTGQTGIKKIKVHGNPQLRPLLCMVSESDGEEEFILLVGAYEISSKYVPADALATAAVRRQEVLEDGTRKTNHVRLINRA